MLNYATWSRQHAAKFSREGLSNIDKRSRYEDYVRSFRAQTDGKSARVSEPQESEARGSSQAGGRAGSLSRGLRNVVTPQNKGPSPRSRVPTRAGGHGQNDADDDAVVRYISQVLDPFGPYDAKQPSLIPYPSVSFTVKETFLVETNNEGVFQLILRDDIDRFRQDTWSVLKNASDDDTNAILHLTSGGGGLSAANPGFAQNYLSTFPKADETRWQKTAEAENISNTFSSFRTVAFGVELAYIDKPLEASGTLCCTLWHPSEPLPRTENTTLASGTWASFQDIMEMENSQTFPAVEGCTLNWRPFGMDVTKLRNTHVIEGPFDDNITHAEKLLSVSSPLEPEVDGALAYLASIGAFGTDSMHTEGAENMRDMWDTKRSSYSPLLVVTGAGLPVSSSTHRVQVCWVIEAVSDERTFSLASPTTIENVHEPEKAQKALNLFSDAKASYPGSSMTGNSEGKKGFLSEVASTAASTAGKVKQGISTGKKIMDGIADVAEVAASIVAFL